MRPAVRTALLGLALVLAGGLFDGEPFYVAGLGLVGIGLGSAGWVALAARGTWIERTVGAASVVEDDPVELALVVGTDTVVLPGGWVEHGLGTEPVRVAPGRTEVRFRINAHFARRGRRVLPPARAVLRDPLGLAERAVAGTRTDEILVLPRVHPVQAPAGWGAAMAGRARSALAVAAEVEVDGLRPYQTSSPASRIHWPALARGHGMMERKLRTDMDARPLVVLDTRGPAGEDAVDEAVRAAASLALPLARAGGCALLLPGERRAAAIDPDLGAWPAAHVRLALVEPGGAPGQSALAPRSGALIYVCARAPRETPRPLYVAAGPRILVVPVALAGRRPAFSVGTCRGYALGRADVRARVAGRAG